jgi:hypothetical protein
LEALGIRRGSEGRDAAQVEAQLRGDLEHHLLASHARILSCGPVRGKGWTAWKPLEPTTAAGGAAARPGATQAMRSRYDALNLARKPIHGRELREIAPVDKIGAKGVRYLVSHRL